MPGRRRLSLHINRVAKENDKDAAPVDLTKVPLIVCGDFNAQPSSPAYRCFSQITKDVQTYGARGRPSPTFFSPRPLARIDHIFVTDDIGVEDACVLNSRLARVASDHLPLVADVVLPQYVTSEYATTASQKEK